MPSEQKLDEVLAEKQAEIKEAIETLKTYNREIEATVQKLRDVRAELNTAAKVRLEDLQKSIPELEAKVADRDCHIIQLDNIIACKQKEVSTEKESCQAHYKNLQELLLKEYSDKHAKLDGRDIAQNRRDEEYVMKNANLVSREVALEDANKKMARDSEAHEIAKKDLLNQKDAFAQDMEQGRQEIADGKKMVSQMTEDLKTSRKEMSDYGIALAEKEIRADAILAQSNDFKRREELLNIRSKELDEKQAAINTAKVGLAVDQKRLNKRMSEIEEKEKALATREQNIRDLEAKVA